MPYTYLSPQSESDVMSINPTQTLLQKYPSGYRTLIMRDFPPEEYFCGGFDGKITSNFL